MGDSHVATEHEILERLAQYRVSRDLTFEQLAEEMQDAGYFVKPRSLHYLLTDRRKGRPMLDRTAYKICQFVTNVVDRPRASRRRAAPPSKGHRSSSARA